MRRLGTVDAVLLVLTTAFVGFTLAPALARVHRSWAEAKCQSNMHRLAEAMAVYCADNADTYPTNRPLGTSGGGLQAVSDRCRLSPPSNDPATGKPMRFKYSVNWLEALYPYVQDSAAKTGQDWHSFLTCPNAHNNRIYPSSTGTAGFRYHATNYVLNFYLVEHSPALVRNPGKLMMLREYPLLAAAILRPMLPYDPYQAVEQSMPVLPFLTMSENVTAPAITLADIELHSTGSHIMFADGHVKWFDQSYYPVDCQWDAATGQWWNFVTDPDPLKNKSIAVTP